MYCTILKFGTRTKGTQGKAANVFFYSLQNNRIQTNFPFNIHIKLHGSLQVHFDGISNNLLFPPTDLIPVGMHHWKVDKLIATKKFNINIILM